MTPNMFGELFGSVRTGSANTGPSPVREGEEPVRSPAAWGVGGVDPGAEFSCLACKGHFTYVDPRPADETPELVARIEAADLAFARGEFE